MFDILMYLFENFVHSETEIRVDQDELTDELIRAGFHHDEIYKALAWLEKLGSPELIGIVPVVHAMVKCSTPFIVMIDIDLWI